MSSRSELYLDAARVVFDDLPVDFEIKTISTIDWVELRVSWRAFDYLSAVRVKESIASSAVLNEVEGLRDVAVRNILNGIAPYREGYPRAAE